jgi:2-hydroxychromene-2-carboxylate isomerase
MTREVELYYDFGSPTSYLAYKRLPTIAGYHGARVILRPMLLGAVLKATGNRSPAEIPAKNAWMNGDMARYARMYGVPFALNPFFPINTLHLMRGAIAAELDGKLKQYSDVIYDAMWCEPKNLGDPKVIAQVLAVGGFDPQQIFAAIERPEVKEKLRRNTDEAVGRGVFGAPAMFVGGEFFFGQDRLHFVEEALSA